MREESPEAGNPKARGGGPITSSGRKGLTAPFDSPIHGVYHLVGSKAVPIRGLWNHIEPDGMAYLR